MSTDRVNGIDIATLYGPGLLANAMPTTAVNVYVATTGNDGNAGTIGAPKKTVAGAWALLPAVLTAPFSVHFAAGTYDWVAPPNALEQRGPRSCITVIGDGAGQGGDDGCAVASSGTIAASSTATIVNVSATITANAMRGYTFESADGSRRHVIANTASQVTLDEGLPAFTTGTAYRLFRPAVLFDMKGPNAAARQAFAQCDLINVVNARIRGGNAEFLACTYVSFFGVEMESQLFLGDYAMAGATGQFPFYRNLRIGNSVAYFAAWVAAAGLTATAVQWNGWGLTATTNTPVVSQYNGVDWADGALFEGYLSIPMIPLGPGAHNLRVELQGGAFANLSAGHSQRYVFGGAGFTIGQGAGLDGNVSLAIGNNVEVLCTAPVTVQNSGGYDTMVVQHSARFCSVSTLTLISGSVQATTVLKVLDSAEVQLATCNLTVGVVPRQFDFAGNSRITCATFGGLNSGGSNSSMLRHNARASFTSLVCSSITIQECSVLQAQSLNANGNGGVVVTGPGARLSVTSSCTIRNTQNSSNQHGLSISAGAAVYSYTSPTITTVASGCYGVLCAGGCFYCVGQPVNVVGMGGIDFCIGYDPNDKFSNSNLNVPGCSYASGASIVQRMD